MKRGMTARGRWILTLQEQRALQLELIQGGQTISDIARKLAIHRPRISAVLRGMESAHPELAMRIARAIGRGALDELKRLRGVGGVAPLPPARLGAGNPSSPNERGRFAPRTLEDPPHGA